MAAQVELFDLPDPGEFPEDLENFEDGGEDWVSLFLENSSALDDDSGCLVDLPDCPDVPLANDASRSPISAVTRHSGSSSPTQEEVVKDEEAGSGTEQCRSDSKPSSSGESYSARSTKRLGKRKVDYDDDKVEDGEADEEEVKRRARLMRNRESAQLSRQRKKAYVDDLEERVRTLNATVAELNNTVSLISAENVNLRNQLAYCYSSNGSKPGAYPPPMGLPVFHYPGGYVLRPGSSAPPVPIPRLKTQASAVKSAKRAKVSKQETAKKPSLPATSGKAKRLSSVAALGLLCVIAVVFPFDFGIPVVERAGQFRSYVSSDPGHARIGGRVLMSLEDEHNKTSQIGWSSRDDKLGCDRADRNGAVIDGSMFPANVSTYGNASHRFPTSLRFPRDNQVVKIDGDLIIQAVMAGDMAATKQVSSRQSPGSDQSHAVALLKSGMFRDIAAQALARTPFPALPPSDGNGEDPRRNLGNDLTGSGLCNEVFQFEINPDPQPGESRSSSSRRNGNYRRNLSAVPLPSSPAGSSGGKNLDSSGDFSQTRSQPSSMVVSIFNPKPEQHSGGTAKDLARIFVVVLVDSVKYVTYSCLLPPQPRVVTG